MAKKNKKTNQQATNEGITLQDQLDSELIAKLKEAKKELAAEEKRKEEERQAQLEFERKQREKNMSFAELLEKYGDKGSKY